MVDEPVSEWIERLKHGDSRASESLWNYYSEKLIRLARQRLSGMPRRAFDEEDVVLSAMNSLFQGAQGGKFTTLQDRDDLWKLLVTLTIRKVTKEQRRHFAEKRGGGNVVGESAFGTEDTARGIEQVMAKDPTPELADQLNHMCDHLVEQLDDEKLAAVAIHKLHGYSNDEIASELECTTRTVERKLNRIRKLWNRIAG